MTKEAASLRIRMQPCEAEMANDAICGKPTAWQSVYAFNRQETRFMWLCDECRAGVESAVKRGKARA
jgi:hypothetical protein